MSDGGPKSEFLFFEAEAIGFLWVNGDYAQRSFVITQPWGTVAFLEVSRPKLID